MSIDWFFWCFFSFIIENFVGVNYRIKEQRFYLFYLIKYILQNENNYQLFVSFLMFVVQLFNKYYRLCIFKFLGRVLNYLQNF